ncbi:NAD(P)H-dependent oxidoreductase [Pontivivens insulae]|uniref:Flavodoxin-like fold domain-containing protein n=1 Tax=Pontivivens insulae TaxID=1639689 RepID=A0A2R8AAL5_9RHOB|nr:NAD(P)H-dependent oxidoreductase [Pontivivens insulae]RED13159.1 putative NADPH-quinone reductase [Pontivivens insulae]SPF29251.1 hypothetical protein POI8812_01558 [Pontivivens insulae]
MTRRIFIWIAHPRANSLNHALAERYASAAREAGADVRVQDLSAMRFSQDFTGYVSGHAPLEPDLLAWQDNLKWADHVLWVHPYWWAGMPSKARAVLERALSPGFAYKYRKTGMLWDKHLTGRTGDVIVTGDTPPILDTLLYGRPGRRAVRNQMLDFVGIKPRKIVQFGAVRGAPERKITRWLDRAAHLGRTAAA